MRVRHKRALRSEGQALPVGTAKRCTPCEPIRTQWHRRRPGEHRSWDREIMGNLRTTQESVKVEERVRWLWDGNQLTNEGVKPLCGPGFGCRERGS